ncbi:MAG: hypothetical protein ACYDGM_05355 [Vulcanimicrobiaceae bacterium]
MRTLLCYGALLFAMVWGGCAIKRPTGHVASASLPPMLIDSRGVTMPLAQVVTKIAYRPYIPRVPVLRFAVIPPLAGTDTPARAGIAIEYAAGKNAMLLSEWPSRNLPVVFNGVNIVLHPCTTVRFDRSSIAWSSHGGLLMTLQPDGTLPASVVASEARRLLANGACR